MFNQIGKDESFSDLLNRFDEAYHPWIDAGKGWGNLIRECHEKLVSFDPNYKIAQIKEKFGGLRYYFNASNPAYTRSMHDRIISLEKKSYEVCEICGAVGKLRKTIDSGWLKTLCDEHASKETYTDAGDIFSFTQPNPTNKTTENLTLYPIVIRESRYQGTYEGGKWHAIPECNSDTWNMDYFEYLHGDDDAATKFWWESDAAKKIGVGKTPNDALADLFKKNFI